MTLGDKIKEFRHEHGISQQQFAERAGCTKAYISILENHKTSKGKDPIPSIEIYKGCARAMGLTTDELVRMVDDAVGFVPSNESEDYRAIIKKCSAMTDEQLRTVRNVIEAMFP